MLSAILLAVGFIVRFGSVATLLSVAPDPGQDICCCQLSLMASPFLIALLDVMLGYRSGHVIARGMQLQAFQLLAFLVSVCLVA